jgi:hypothetical protein
MLQLVGVCKRNIVKAGGAHMETNKRCRERIKTSGVIYYSNAHNGGKPEILDEDYEGQIVDICSGGICISTRHKFDFGAKVQFDIEDHYKGTFTGVVRWCVMSTDDKYYVGLEVPFTNGSDLVT